MPDIADAAAQAAATQPEEAPLRAFVTEAFKPDRINVLSPEPGQVGDIVLQFFIGAAGPNVFLHGKNVSIDADAAIGIGEYLVEAGRRVKTGLVVPRPQVPVDIRS